MRPIRAALFAAAMLVVSGCGAFADIERQLERIELPPGFEISLYAEVPGARSLLVVPELGVVFVSTRDEAVYALFDDGLDGGDVVRRVAADGREVANGIAWTDGALYVAEQPRIVRYRFPDRDAIGRAAPEAVMDGLPNNSWHGWRYAEAGPDGRLYVAVGAPCNVCPLSGLEGTIITVDPASGSHEIFARGVRNSVGLAFHPRSKVLYFTDNGADNMGDTVPPDELNRAQKAGLHFGFPWYGGGEARTSIGGTPPEDVVFPLIGFTAHAAALGVHFYQGAMLPDEYRLDAFVAQHGSWNRSTPVGARVMRVRLDGEGNPTGKEVFAEGWQFADGSRWGRPVDVAEMPDGSLLVSDDHADAVYRITYSKSR